MEVEETGIGQKPERERKKISIGKIG